MAVKAKRQVYKCNVCGNIVEVLVVGGGTLTCCNQEMALQEENTTDAAQEKHVPVIEKTDDGYNVKVGSVAHPMEDKHYIQAIELIAGEKSYLQLLNPGDAPKASFKVSEEGVVARAHCNLHGLWKS